MNEESSKKKETEKITLKELYEMLYTPEHISNVFRVAVDNDLSNIEVSLECPYCKQMIDITSLSNHILEKHPDSEANKTSRK